VVQAKHIRRLSQGVAVDDLVSQIRQCFHVAYTVPFAPDDVRHVSAVYVFNTGEITENAKDQMVSMLDAPLRSNVFIFGGHQLEAIERTGMYRRLEEIRRSVASLRAQLGFNIAQWRMAQQTLKPQCGQPSWHFGPSFVAGIELHLANPVLPEIITIKDLGALWSNIGIFEQIHTKHIISPRSFPPEVEREDISTVFELIDSQLIPIAMSLSQRIEEWILTLPIKDF
jgi:hypothetical protein